MFNKTSIFFLVLLMGCCAFTWANLLPAIEKQNQPDGWQQVRTAATVALFAPSVLDNKPAMKVTIDSDSGYAFYRCFLPLVAGAYQLRTQATGNTDEGITLEVYAYYPDQEPRRIADYKTPAGAISSTTLTLPIKVPEGTTGIRFGLGFSRRGTAIFAETELLPGNAEEIPPAFETGEPALREWVANWLWLRQHQGVAQAVLCKELMLDEVPVTARVQVTADNAYTLQVNGTIVGSDVDWKTVETYDISSFLRRGKNEISLAVMNYDGPGGAILQGFVIDARQHHHVLQTDASWSISRPDGGPADLEVLGPPPADPWRQLPFHQIIPPKQLQLPLLRSQNELLPGRVFSLEFACSREFTPAELAELNFYFYDEDGQERPLSAYAPLIRQELTLKRLYIELPTSRFAAPGHYRWQLRGVLHDLLPEGGETVLTVLSAPLDTAVSLGAHLPTRATNRIAIGQEGQAPFVYCTATPSLDNYAGWQQTGGHFYEVYLHSGHWRSNGRFDTSSVERAILQILEFDAFASVTIRFRIDIPGWWAARYPDDIFRSNRQRFALQSFCSLQWQQDAAAAVSAAMHDLAARPAGRALGGALLMGFRGGEFQLWGEDTGEYDCSPVALRAFAQYQLAQTGKDTIKLPHPALETPLLPVNPEAQQVRDLYFRFLADRHADNIIWFAREFKREFSEKYRFGVYFGYGIEHSGNANRMLFAGHLGLERVLREAPLDFLSCPFSYALRRRNQSHAYMFPADSLLKHGILPLAENDVRNYRTSYLSDSSGRTILTLVDSALDTRRMNLFSATHGTAVRYLALLDGTDFFAAPEIRRCIADDNALVRGLEPAPYGAPDQLALVSDQFAWTGSSVIPDRVQLMRNFVCDLRDTVMRTGRSVVFLAMADYLDDISKWNYAVISMPGLLSAETRTELEKRWGELPAMQLTDGALVLGNGIPRLVNDPDQVRELLATPAARLTGAQTVWYIGGNFTAQWDGEQLQISR